MRRFQVTRQLRLLIVGTAAVAALALPVAALADTTGTPSIPQAFSNHATIQLTGGSIIGRLVANVAVDFTCDPFLVYDWGTGTETEATTGSLEYGSVTILQVAGRTINSGQADFYGGAVVCDGSTVNHRDVGVIAGVVPWKGGSAVGGAQISVSSPDYQTFHNAATGPVTIKLGR